MLKQVFFLLFISLSFYSRSQQVSFKGELIDTIKIKSHLAAYQFDDNGTTKGAEEIYTIFYSKTDSSYYCLDYKKVEFEVAFKNNPDKVKEKSLTDFQEQKSQ